MDQIANALHGAPQLSAGTESIRGLFAPARPRVSTILSDAMEMAAARKRRVFFSFHYQLDINRVNVVRNSWRFRPTDGTQPADWFDHSIWEEAKRTGTLALKRLIHSGMNRSSVTCVLAGQSTWGRPWVRYEIAYGLARGNGLLTVFINGVKCMKTGLCQRGPNPLDYMGLSLDDRGQARIWENFNGRWRLYALHPDPVAWPAWLPKADKGFISVLGLAAASYDYQLQDGYTNLAAWADKAAQQAGR